ncbi:MAG TPA: radical SAM protein, partial [Bacteroidales bacterium]|nr:radical SAM protein [Bacteroidales bacterium]
SKRVKGTIGFGSMNDPYMAIEKEQQLTRQALQLVKRFRFPVHIITKSNLVVRDIDLLKEIAKVYAAVSITITTANDFLSKEIEPGAPVSSLRFEALKVLSDAGIYAGITLMPVLPFITDDFRNLEELIIKAKESGVKYILASTGMTLREGQREYFYDQLNRRFPGLKERYIQTYGNTYSCNVPHAHNLWHKLNALCQSLSIPVKMEYYKPIENQQLKLF